jgi:hypothetical protein
VTQFLDKFQLKVIGSLERLEHFIMKGPAVGFHSRLDGDVKAQARYAKLPVQYQAKGVWKVNLHQCCGYYGSFILRLFPKVRCLTWAAGYSSFVGGPNHLVHCLGHLRSSLTHLSFLEGIPPLKGWNSKYLEVLLKNFTGLEVLGLPYWMFSTETFYHAAMPPTRLRSLFLSLIDPDHGLQINNVFPLRRNLPSLEDITYVETKATLRSAIPNVRCWWRGENGLGKEIMELSKLGFKLSGYRFNWITREKDEVKIETDWVLERLRVARCDKVEISDPSWYDHERAMKCGRRGFEKNIMRFEVEETRSLYDFDKWAYEKGILD